MSATVRTLEELPPSAKLVHTVLRREGPLTQRGLARETRLTPRTVRHATGILEEAAHVESRPNPGDRRQSLYSVPDQ